MNRTLRTGLMVWAFTRFFYQKYSTFCFIGSECWCPSYFTCNSICYYTHTHNTQYAFCIWHRRTKKKKEQSNRYTYCIPTHCTPLLISTKNNFSKVFWIVGQHVRKFRVTYEKCFETKCQMFFHCVKTEITFRIPKWNVTFRQWPDDTVYLNGIQLFVIRSISSIRQMGDRIRFNCDLKMYLLLAWNVTIDWR